MCQSLTISFLAWCLILISAIILIIRNHKNDRWISLFLLVFGQIQVVEAILWAMYKTSTESPQTLHVERFATFETSAIQMGLFAIVIILWAQPLINCLGAYLDTHKPIFAWGCCLYFVFLIYGAVEAYDDTFYLGLGPHNHFLWIRFQKCVEIEHLIGGHIRSAIYLTGMLLPFFYLENLKCRVTVITYGVATFLYSMIFFQSEFGSMWCVHAIFLGVVTLIFN
jgi:hypothetical protein